MEENEMNRIFLEQLALAQKGHAHAQYAVAIILLNGPNAFSKDPNRDLTPTHASQISFIRDAAAQENGDGEALKNYEEAIIWLEKAAKQNYAPAQCDLATFYMLDSILGHRKDAIPLYRQAARQNDPFAILNIEILSQLVEKPCSKPTWEPSAPINFLPSYRKPKPKRQPSTSQEATATRYRKMPPCSSS